METQTTPQTPSTLPVETTADGVSNSSPAVISVDKALSWAKLYLKLGWSLVPISPETKIPTIAWKKYQTTPPTLEEVTSWINKGWYLAVITGDVSGVCVIDDDRIKNGLPEYGFTSPVVATTQSGGKHYYYKYDREIHTHVNTKLHVDLKGWHSYVLVPPFKGRKWETPNLVSDLQKIIPLPEANITLIRSDMENLANHTPLEYKDLLDVSEGSRSESLYKMACGLFNNLDFDSGKRLLIAANDSYTPPLKDKQRDYDIQRAWDFVQSHPKDTLVSVSTELKSKVKLSDNSTTSDKDTNVPIKTDTIDLYQKFPLLKNSDFLSASYPPAKWLIDKLIRIGGISLIVGESGTGKTIAAISIAKAVSEGSSWLNHFPATKTKVLIIDKENTPSDIQKHFKSMGIYNDDIFLFFTQEDYELIDSKAKLTQMGIYLQQLIKDNNIGLVIFDSAIDFLLGDENDSRTVAANINAWRTIAGEATILTIHHEGKPDPKARRKSLDRPRGSGVWVSSAQSVVSLSVFTQDHPEILLVEHTKVRGGAKAKPFQIEMVIRPDPTHPGETIVDGYKYLKEIIPIVLKKEVIQELILKFLDQNPTTYYTAKEIVEAVETEEYKSEAIRRCLPEMVSLGNIEKSGAGKMNDPFVYKMCVSVMLEKVIKEEEKNVDNSPKLFGV